MSCFINQKLESITSRKCSLELQNVNAYFVSLWKILDNSYVSHIVYISLPSQILTCMFYWGIFKRRLEISLSWAS